MRLSLREILFGKPKDVLSPQVFHQVSLIAILLSTMNLGVSLMLLFIQGALFLRSYVIYFVRAHRAFSCETGRRSAP